MSNQINYKFLRVLIMHFYILVWFHIQRHFCDSLSVRVYDPGQPVTYVRKFCTKNIGHKIYHCIPAGSTLHYILLHNPKILHAKTFFALACPPRKKISSDKNLFHSSLLNPCALHTSLSNSIDSIKLDHSPLGWNTNESILLK